MIPLHATAFLVAMMCLVAVGFGVSSRIEAHIRRHHPLLVNELFPPPPPIGPKDEEERSTQRAAQMLFFLWSGRPGALRDSALDRLVTTYRSLMGLFGVLFVSAIAWLMRS